MDRPPNLLPVTTHQLQYLLAMDRAETLSEAAAELGLTTSALSQALTELERRVGLSLFERRGRARSLSARGREMIPHAERILGAIRDLTLWAQEVGQGVRGTIRLGLIDIAAIAYLPDALVRFRVDRPDVELHLTIASSAALVERLSDGRLDLAVIVAPTGDDSGPTGDDGSPPVGDIERELPGLPDLVASDLLAEELAVYGPPDRAGRGLPPSRWGPWVTFPSSSHTHHLIAAAIRALGIEFRVEAESHQPEVLRQLVNLGLGWTVLPVLQAETEPNPLVRARRAPLLTRRLVLARRRSTPVDPVTADVMERLRASAGAHRRG